MFSVNTTHFGFVFEKNLGKKIDWLSFRFHDGLVRTVGLSLEIKAAFSHFFGVGCKGRNYINAAFFIVYKACQMPWLNLAPFARRKVCRRNFSVSSRNWNSSKQRSTGALKMRGLKLIWTITLNLFFKKLMARKKQQREIFLVFSYLKLSDKYLWRFSSCSHQNWTELEPFKIPIWIPERSEANFFFT